MVYFAIIIDLSIFAKNQYSKLCTANYTKNQEAI